MKMCTNCKESKPLSEFARKTSNVDGLQKMCRACKKEYNSKYYVRTASRYKDQRAASRDRVRALAQQTVVDYLLTHPCVDCGESDIVVLDFDHVRDKEYDIARMVTSKTPEQIMAEIAKCEVRCANCHRRKTAERLGGNYRTRAVASLAGVTGSTSRS